MLVKSDDGTDSGTTFHGCEERTYYLCIGNENKNEVGCSQIGGLSSVSLRKFYIQSSTIWKIVLRNYQKVEWVVVLVVSPVIIVCTKPRKNWEKEEWDNKCMRSINKVIVNWRDDKDVVRSLRQYLSHKINNKGER